MVDQTGVLCQILQMQQQLAQRLQQQPPHSANSDGPNLVTQTMNFAGKDPEKPRPYESFSPRVPAQADMNTIAGAIKILEQQNSVLSQIVYNILQDRYHGLSETTLTNNLSQVLSTSMVEQARLCNLLVDHMNQNQLSTFNSLLPASKLPMDLTKEEGKSQSHKRAFPKMDLSEWGITYREFCPRKGKQSDDIGKIDQLVERETRSQAETLEEQMRKSFYAYHQLCFNCGDRNHLLQSCPSSAWSDPRDWNILSRQGR
jgi:hypothetical protein